MNTDFTKDRKSGFINILGLIETDIRTWSGSNGILIAVSIEDIRTINASHGRQFGDIYVHDLIQSLHETLHQINMRHDAAKVFRISSNEYVLMVPQMPFSDADAVMRILEASYNTHLQSQDMPPSTLLLRKVAYRSAIPAVAHVLKWSNKSLLEPGYTDVLDFEEIDWTNKLIERTLLCFSETLAMLRDVHAISLSDDISKLPNHRAASACLARLFTQYRAGNRQFSVLFIDGDNLKRYNQLGYQAGNRMIEGMARILSLSLREHDQVFRWLSGDEFLVCLPDTDLASAMRIGERIRAAVESGTTTWEFPVTISVGVANCPLDGASLDTLLPRAEAANSAAKDHGKNQVVHCPITA